MAIKLKSINEILEAEEKNWEEVSKDEKAIFGYIEQAVRNLRRANKLARKDNRISTIINTTLKQLQDMDSTVTDIILKK